MQALPNTWPPAAPGRVPRHCVPNLISACFGTRLGRHTGICLGLLAFTFGSLDAADARPPAPALTALTSQQVQADAQQFIDLVAANYAYADRALGGPPLDKVMEPAIGGLRSEDDLLRFMQRALHWLADPHAISATATPDAYALVPSFADIWVEERAGRFIVEDVRRGSVAETAGLRPGDELLQVGATPIASAIAEFWGGRAFAGLSLERRAYAARALAAGVRNQERRLTFSRGGPRFELRLPTLYADPIDRASDPFSVSRTPEGFGLIRVNDSLSQNDAIRAWDAAIASLADTRGLILDLRDTASGGNTTVARAIMSSFVDKVQAYQLHERPSEERHWGVRRLWVEQVSPRGAFYSGPVVVLYGRWTASMGEGLSIGMQAAAGAWLIGSDFADLLGGIERLSLDNSGLGFFLPVERLSHVNGMARERCRPNERLSFVDALAAQGEDAALVRAIAHLNSKTGTRALP